jgi:hypothetical protein
LGSEAIASSGNGSQKVRVFRVIFQGLARLSHSRVDAVVGVNKHVFPPDGAQDLLSRDEPVAVFGEQEEQLQRNPLDLDEATRLAQFKRARIKLKVIESKCLVKHGSHTRGLR